MAGICRLGAKLKSADCLLFSLVLALVKMPNSAPMMRVEIVFSWANTFDEEKKIREKRLLLFSQITESVIYQLRYLKQNKENYEST